MQQLEPIGTTAGLLVEGRGPVDVGSAAKTTVENMKTKAIPVRMLFISSSFLGWRRPECCPGRNLVISD